jgi:hypothetical protein
MDVEIGKQYYYLVGKSSEYKKVKVIGKRYYPEDRTDGGFIYTVPTNIMAVGNVLDPASYNKFFQLCKPKEIVPNSYTQSTPELTQSDEASPIVKVYKTETQDNSDKYKNILKKYGK